MNMLQMSFFFVLSMFQEYQALINQCQRPPEIGSANDEVRLLRTDALIRYSNTRLAISWLLRDVSNLAFDRLSTDPVENFFHLLRNVIHDVNTLNRMLKTTTSLRLMNEGIETLSDEGDPDVQRIPTRMNMAGVKLRKAQIDQQDSPWLTTRIECPNEITMVCLRACCHSADIGQNNGNSMNFLNI
jgi:hypothetical protein